MTLERGNLEPERGRHLPRDLLGAGSRARRWLQEVQLPSLNSNPLENLCQPCSHSRNC